MSATELVLSSPSGRVTRRTAIVAVDVASLLTQTAVDTAILVPGALVGDGVLCTPLGTWPVGAVIGPSRVLVAGTVQMRVGNVTVGAVDPASQNFRIDLLRG